MMAALPDYNVQHSPKARNIRLKVTRENGLIVVVPAGYDIEKIPALLKQKKEWLADSMKRIGETRRFLEPTPVTHLPEVVRLVALGETWAVTYQNDISQSGFRLRTKGEKLIISGPGLNREAVIRKLKDWLRMKVREDLFPLAEKLAKKHQLNLGRLFVKSQRTRWASCSAQRNLSLNTKLLFLSPELVRYIVIHELCHTVHMNHGSDFWRLVASHEANYKTLDKELRTAWKTVPQWLF